MYVCVWAVCHPPQFHVLTLSAASCRIITVSYTPLLISCDLQLPAVKCILCLHIKPDTHAHTHSRNIRADNTPNSGNLHENSMHKLYAPDCEEKQSARSCTWRQSYIKCERSRHEQRKTLMELTAGRSVSSTSVGASL